ncbi:4-hydroxyphenylpyruvate dioxygenase [Streptomyces sp. NBC_01754]|uniref:4-hydroxyphenylpyruvate dioxygenase n=1 Tax=Streptomyces sp. NBC_01754 TaxID=2975930 RepID=UPI002DD90D0E|nr:4-hydroxyphenylpyruvate dioxygenase [Streptomyces sp. NBC_01754]WSC90933.1 4-hydroxyphenylpyruvate dioxygenase [Streptomyces sp. NBC_01754]WSC96573.1 4-hydroxyphenylpyruvate dioxygenase [Streptomyces sp. NBC_01754]
MPTSDPCVFDDLRLDHIRFHVRSIDTTLNWLTGGYGLTVRALPVPGTDPGGETGARSVEVGANDISLVLTEPVTEDHPAAHYVARHGDGVADIALRVPDAAAAHAAAVARGARSVTAPTRTGELVTASVGGFGDLVHTFVERPDGAPGPAAPGMRPAPQDVDTMTSRLRSIDHFAVCVAPGDIDDTVAFYQNVFDFELTFSEKLQIGAQAMTTKVVESRSGDVTLTLIEPDITQEPGHINEFLDQHGCAGVQHIAFATDDIVTTVAELRRRGVAFMNTPDTYYRTLMDRVVPTRYTVDELHTEEILVDEDHGGQLYQIFAKSVHPRNTVFLELIERMGAQTFGSGNITALYEAAERQRGATGPESKAA